MASAHQLATSPLGRVTRHYCTPLASFDFRTALVMAMGRTTQFTLDEVAKHADKDSCWLVIEGKVYAVEKFLNEHPGGEDVLLETAGRDATREFEDVGHSKSAREQLKEFYIGDVREPTAEELAAKRAVQASAAAERRDGDGVRANGLGKERLFAGGAFGAEPLSGGSSTWTLLKRLFVPVCIAVLVYLVREYSKQVQTGG
jgi:cytochrome b involved in lipid metabolism